MTIATVETSADKGSVRISLGGEIDLANAETVEEQISAAVSGEPTAVSVDLTNLTYMDSVGIRLLFDMASDLQKSHIVLELVAPFETPARCLIELSGIDSLVTLHPPNN
jgi:anti-anti-sigma factor